LRVTDGERKHRRGMSASLIGLVAAASFVVAGCGDDSSGGGTTSAGEAPTVAVLSVGAKDDTRWGQSWYEGGQEAGLGDKFSFTGNVNSPDQYISQGSAFASQGEQMLILANGGVAKAAADLADQFPNTTFCQGTYQPTEAQTAKEPPNVCHIDVEQQEPSFLAGVVAGLATKTNVVGAINAFKFPALTRQPEAFALGARCVNADVQFVQKYINSFTDAAFAKAATLSEMRDGADVIYSVTDDATEGVYAAARTQPGTYVIPQYFDSFDAAPDVVLTTVEFDIPAAEADLIKQASAEGGLPDHFFKSYDITEGYGGLADFHDNADALSPDAMQTYEDIKSKVESGEIEVPDESEGANPIGTVGAGTQIDPESMGCSPA
jgi:basic membrane protein A